MWNNLLLAIACSFALAVFVEPVAAKAPAAKTHTGTVVSAGMGKLSMKGPDGKEHSHDVPESAMITVHGKPGKLEDLKAGERIRVTTDGDDKVTAVATLDARKKNL